EDATNAAHLPPRTGGTHSPGYVHARAGDRKTEAPSYPEAGFGNRRRPRPAGTRPARISHSSSPPCPVMLFLSRRFSRVTSANASFRSRLARRNPFTSSLVAERAVSPASRLLPTSRNSFDQL